MDAIHTENYRGYTLKIIPDDDATSPREWDNLGTMVCWHRRYLLGDEQPKQDVPAWLEGKLGLDDEQVETLSQSASSHQDYTDALLAELQKQAVVLSLYLYDHSGLSMNTTGFDCRWDSGPVGFIYVDLDDVRREYSALHVSSSLRQNVETALKAEVSTYDEYLRGNVHGFVIESGGEEVDACWGFMGDYEDHCLSEARNVADFLLGSELPLLDGVGRSDAPQQAFE